jgi:hypothetical protein
MRMLQYPESTLYNKRQCWKGYMSKCDKEGSMLWLDPLGQVRACILHGLVQSLSSLSLQTGHLSPLAEWFLQQQTSSLTGLRYMQRAVCDLLRMSTEQRTKPAIDNPPS